MVPARSSVPPLTFQVRLAATPEKGFEAWGGGKPANHTPFSLPVPPDSALQTSFLRKGTEANRNPQPLPELAGGRVAMTWPGNAKP